METKNSTRRDFCKTGLVVLGSLPLMATIRGVSTARAEATQPLDENDPQAIALGFKHDATKVDTVKYPKRKSPEGDKQFCKNCILLTKSGINLPGKDGEWGSCSIFMSGLVNVNGWCNTWAQKAS